MDGSAGESVTSERIEGESVKGIAGTRTHIKPEKGHAIKSMNRTLEARCRRLEQVEGQTHNSLSGAHREGCSVPPCLGVGVLVWATRRR